MAESKTLRDLQSLMGIGRPACIRAIESGQLPGYRVGDGTYRIPNDAFELLKLGYWEPVAARIEQVKPTHPLVRRRDTPPTTQ